jgi:hypothetical protein
MIINNLLLRGRLSRAKPIRIGTKGEVKKAVQFEPAGRYYPFL